MIDVAVQVATAFLVEIASKSTAAPPTARPPGTALGKAGPAGALAAAGSSGSSGESTNTDADTGADSSDASSSGGGSGSESAPKPTESQDPVNADTSDLEGEASSADVTPPEDPGLLDGNNPNAGHGVQVAKDAATKPLSEDLAKAKARHSSLEQLEGQYRDQVPQARQELNAALSDLEKSEMALERTAHLEGRMAGADEYADLRNDVVQAQKRIEAANMKLNVTRNMADDFARQADEMARTSTDLARRIQLIEKGAAGFGMASVMLDLESRLEEVTRLAKSGDMEGAVGHSFGGAARGLADGLLALPNGLGLVSGLAVGEAVGLVAEGIGDRAGRAVSPALNQVAHWLYDNGYTPESWGRPRFPRGHGR